jgi:hypothetical protein
MGLVSLRCHSERSEESLIGFRRLASADKRRTFGEPLCNLKSPICNILPPCRILPRLAAAPLT